MNACPTPSAFSRAAFSTHKKNIFLYSPQKEKCNNAIIAITSAVPCIEYYKKTWYKGHNNSDS